MFVTAALAGLGCTSHEPALVTTGISTPPDALPEPCLSIAVDPGRFAPIAAQAPPLSVSSELGGDEKTELEALTNRLREAYRLLARAYDATPIACSLDAPGCEATWEQVVEDLRAVRSAIKGDLCGGGETVGLLQRAAEHRRFIGGVADKIEAELATAAGRAGAEQKWAAWARRISRPEACLKCGIPPPRSFNIDSQTALAIGFQERSADRFDDYALKAMKELVERDKDSRVVLRGHADPGEPDPVGLGRARAEAVQRALIGMGVDAARVKVMSLGAELPIGNSSTPEGRALNRRVDAARE